MQISKNNFLNSKKNNLFFCRGNNNLLECISNGAVHASQFVWAIGANLIVYIALLAMLNTWAGFIGTRLGYDDWSFNVNLL